jgi:hypothetical protein
MKKKKKTQHRKQPSIPLFKEKNKFLIRNYTSISIIINKNKRRNPTTQITNNSQMSSSIHIKVDKTH